ncbi:MAG: hypothetical protein H7A33_07820 [Deltaproteobacteria bacterium]|nr:hypothetical protein [Deltaproteobacteria bacterium]
MMKRFYILILLLLTNSCGVLPSSEQFTNKMVAPAFVSELYGQQEQTIAIRHQEASHVSWLGFIQSNDYKYFTITKVAVGDNVIFEDGAEIDGELTVASSNSIVQDFSVSPTSASNNEVVNGNINVAGTGDLKVTIRFQPLRAVESDDNPFEAFLIVNYDQPKQGSLRVRLEGFTQGMKDEKCTQDPSTMEIIEYQVVDSTFDFYLCGSEVASQGQANTPTDSSDPAYHGSSTNLTPITLTNPTITFYQPDDETICVLTEPTPTVPDFVFPIPEGLAPVNSLDVSIEDNSFAECTLDASGNIFCDKNILIDTLVPLSGVSLSNQSFTEEELMTTDCPDFGSISGQGAFGDSDINLVLYGTILSDQNTEEYNIVDSLIVVDLPLTK